MACLDERGLAHYDSKIKEYIHNRFEEISIDKRTIVVQGDDRGESWDKVLEYLDDRLIGSLPAYGAATINEYIKKVGYVIITIIDKYGCAYNFYSYNIDDFLYFTCNTGNEVYSLDCAMKLNTETDCLELRYDDYFIHDNTADSPEEPPEDLPEDSPIDSEMSDESTNAVQNKVIKSYVDTIVNDKTQKIEKLEGDVSSLEGDVNELDQYVSHLAPNNIGAAASQHEHSSQDITDIIPLGKGGTGTNTAHKARKNLGIEVDTIEVPITRNQDGLYRGRADITFTQKTGFTKYKYFVTPLKPWGYVAHCAVTAEPTSLTATISVEADVEGEVMDDNTIQEVNVLCIYSN